MSDLDHVEVENCQLSLEKTGFPLELGGKLDEVVVGFERYGELSEKKDNVILICHALTGDAHATGRYSPDDRKPGWWSTLIGPGKGIDTNKFHVICSNILGGCQGTAGPSSIDPSTGKSYGLSFPDITIGDMVAVQKALLAQLGIDHLFAVIGGSAGGVQVLEWCARFPDFTDRAICIAAAESLSAQALSFDIVSRKIIMNDPAWCGGNYYGDQVEGASDKGANNGEALSGLAMARMIAHITYLSTESMNEKFGRERRADTKAKKFTTDFQVESYLNYQGESFVSRFDANSYLYITQAMNRFSLRERADSLNEVFEACETKLLFISLSSDWLYPSEQSRELASALRRAGKHVSYFELQSEEGHDAFLLESEEFSSVVESFLQGNRTLTSTKAQEEVLKREDLCYMRNIISAGSTVLDLGCGEGDFLEALAIDKQVKGHGIDIDVKSICACNRKDIPVFQADISQGLSMIPDRSYDYAVMGRTLPEVQQPDFVIDELLRVAREVLISFPNFANWYHRYRLGLGGQLPLSHDLPYEWYNTPNIHFTTLKDFEKYLSDKKIQVLDKFCIGDTEFSRTLIKLGFENLGANSIVVRLTR